MKNVEENSLIHEVRLRDYDRFLAIQLAPPSVRPSLYAITAFSTELARIAETVSEPMLGQIRLAWWREALEEVIVGKTPRNHPVVKAMAGLYEKDPAILQYAFTMIDARGADLNESLLAQEGEWVKYLAGTAGALHLAWAQLLNAEAAQAEREAILTQAQNYAMAGLILSIPYMRAQGFLRFPQSMLNEHKISTLNLNDNLILFVKALVEKSEANITYKLTHSDLAPLRAVAMLRRTHIAHIRKFKYNPYKIKNSKVRAVLAVMLSKNR